MGVSADSGSSRRQGRYRITAVQVEVPDHAQLRVSGQLRSLIGVLVLGGILLFIVLSIAEALQLRREELLPSWAVGEAELRPATGGDAAGPRPGRVSG